MESASKLTYVGPRGHERSMVHQGTVPMYPRIDRTVLDFPYICLSLIAHMVVGPKRGDRNGSSPRALKKTTHRHLESRFFLIAKSDTHKRGISGTLRTKYRHR